MLIMFFFLLFFFFSIAFWTLVLGIDLPECFAFLKDFNIPAFY
jgi:hypothetical protein